MLVLELKVGDIVNIAGNVFPVNSKCNLTVDGIMTQNDIPEFEKYIVIGDFISLENLRNSSLIEEINREGKTYFFEYTSTDIGGYHLIVNNIPVAFLKNRHGDGDYYIDFQEGRHM